MLEPVKPPPNHGPGNTAFPVTQIKQRFHNCREPQENASIPRRRRRNRTDGNRKTETFCNIAAAFCRQKISVEPRKSENGTGNESIPQDQLNRGVHSAPWSHCQNKNVFSDCRKRPYDKSGRLRSIGTISPFGRQITSPREATVTVRDEKIGKV